MASISVIVPTHDRCERLLRALAGVQAQSALSSALEILVVADGCRDTTVSAVTALAAADDRIRVFEVTAGGAAAARNVGLAAASGEYIAFLDDDDEWLPSKLARQLAYLDAHPDVGVVGCHWVTQYSGGREVTFRDPERVDGAGLLWCNFVGGCSPVVIRRSAVPPAELRFDPGLTTCEDWDLWQRLAGHTRVAIVPDVLVRYHAHAGARLSDSLTDASKGRLAFARRHEAAMSELCRSYHHVRHALATTHGVVRRGRLAAQLVRSAPARSLWIVANESLAARAGMGRGDPCLGHRRLQRLIPR